MSLLSSRWNNKSKNVKTSKKNNGSQVTVWKTHKQIIVSLETLKCAYVLQYFYRHLNHNKIIFLTFKCLGSICTYPITQLNKNKKMFFLLPIKFSLRQYISNSCRDCCWEKSQNISSFQQLSKYSFFKKNVLTTVNVSRLKCSLLLQHIY